MGLRGSEPLTPSLRATGREMAEVSWPGRSVIREWCRVPVIRGVAVFAAVQQPAAEAPCPLRGPPGHSLAAWRRNTTSLSRSATPFLHSLARTSWPLPWTYRAGELMPDAKGPDSVVTPAALSTAQDRHRANPCPATTHAAVGQGKSSTSHPERYSMTAAVAMFIIRRARTTPTYFAC